MTDKERVIKERISHSGIFDFPAFYGFVHYWLEEEGYGVVERKYAEKVTGNTREISIEWKATKKLSDYFKIEIELDYEVKELSDVEVEIDGKKKKMNKGKIEIELTGNLIKDPESSWESTPLNRFLRDVYNKYIIPTRVESMNEKVKADVRDIKEEMKAFFTLSGRR